MLTLGRSYSTPYKANISRRSKIAMVEFWVTQMYGGVTQMYDVVMKKQGNWYVLCMGILVSMHR